METAAEEVESDRDCYIRVLMQSELLLMSLIKDFKGWFCEVLLFVEDYALRGALRLANFSSMDGS